MTRVARLAPSEGVRTLSEYISDAAQSRTRRGRGKVYSRGDGTQAADEDV
jgi:hypothetical protein